MSPKWLLEFYGVGRAVRATQFEFRYQFLLLVAIFFVGFELRLGHSRLITAQWLAMLTGHSTPGLIQAFVGAGAWVVALTAAIRTWASAYTAAGVVADGPYRYVRHPLYLGYILIVAGLGVLARFPNWILLMIVSTIFCWRLIKREEDALARCQGETYLAPRRPRWLQAWGAESLFWVLAAGQFYFALTFDYDVFIKVIESALMLYAMAQVGVSLLRKRQAA